ncbi:hypothetical protein QCB44_01275 [Thiomicrorhabdus sp. zzn3]|uniref:hypothetical protein n=1 Tax=Thiomicrorhabdus sp. zzn3 TaxID=3039775 RepID=UPI002436D1AF|nr:hypothetical protein [Thiomicrorhabdus sp. zzn3]MDG6777328.1 hypothetical protein [Thiomicrorhabdus sp. zzn3]
MKKSICSGLLACLSLFMLPSANAFNEACQLVAKMAGPAYVIQENRVASFTPPDKMPEEFELTLLEQNGGWFVYQTQQAWFDKETCALLHKPSDQGRFDFAPVLLNQSTGSHAVVTSSFMIKTYRKQDIEKMAERYHFRLLTLLPSGSAAIFDVGEVASYDRMLETLDRDKDVQVAAPLLSEPRYRLR